MTNIAIVTPECALKEIDKAATDIQKKALQLEHLIAVCEECHRGVQGLEGLTDAGKKEAGERIDTFLDLAGGIATEIAELADKVEFAKARLQRPVAA